MLKMFKEKFWKFMKKGMGTIKDEKNVERK
jgi:hypothetical protein